VGKVACWSTKAAISLKRVKIEEKIPHRLTCMGHDLDLSLSHDVDVMSRVIIGFSLHDSLMHGQLAQSVYSASRGNKDSQQ